MAGLSRSGPPVGAAGGSAPVRISKAYSFPVAAADQEQVVADGGRVPDGAARRRRPGRTAIRGVDRIHLAVGGAGKTRPPAAAAVCRMAPPAFMVHRSLPVSASIPCRVPRSVPTKTRPSAITGWTPAIRPSSGNSRYHLHERRADLDGRRAAAGRIVCEHGPVLGRAGFHVAAGRRPYARARTPRESVRPATTS